MYLCFHFEILEQMRKPRILITTNIRNVGPKRRLSATTATGYIRSVEHAGGIPLLLPPLMDTERVSALLFDVDGVICIGGPDYRRGGEHPRCAYVHPIREEHDFRLISLLLDSNVPVLGICLGMQLMNIGAGGDIYQHLPDRTAPVVDHVRSNHEVILSHESHLRSVLEERFMVNSSHHQAIRTVGHGFVDSAYAPDGVIEMIERTGDIFQVGIQWHPERMLNSSVHETLFSIFSWSAMNKGQWP